MALEIETDGLFSDDLEDAATYTDATDNETDISVIVSPQSYEISELDSHVSTVRRANILVKESDLSGVTVTLETDTITVGSDVWTVLAEPVNLGGVLQFECELQTELSIELRGRDR